jgi:hypothetical protein
LVDVMLSEHRDLAAARAFFRSAKAVTGVTPDRITTDGHDAYPSAIRTEFGKHVRHRTSRYLNNRLEQDHRGIKSRCRPMLGLKSTVSAARYCRDYDELRNFLRCRSRMREHVPPLCGVGGTCGKPRLSSLSWQQLESWRRWSKLAELNGAKTDRTPSTTDAVSGLA